MFILGELTKKIHALGYRVGDVVERLWHEKGIDITYQGVTWYLRSPNRDTGKPEIWQAIDEIIEEMEAEKNGR
jgi:hypothetical protein